MKTTRRTFLHSSAIASLGAAQQLVAASTVDPAETELRGPGLDASAIAREHTMHRDIPGPSFFEGMLLGNGDVGICAVVRPDALGLHIGKNDCWDIRVSEDINGKVLPFADVLTMWRRASDEAKKQGQPDMIYLEEKFDYFREYSKTVSSTYSHRWPRPWPCGTGSTGIPAGSGPRITVLILPMAS